MAYWAFSCVLQRKPTAVLVLACKSDKFDDISWIWCFCYRFYKVLSPQRVRKSCVGPYEGQYTCLTNILNCSKVPGVPRSAQTLHTNFRFSSLCSSCNISWWQETLLQGGAKFNTGEMMTILCRRRKFLCTNAINKGKIVSILRRIWKK